MGVAAAAINVIGDYGYIVLILSAIWYLMRTVKETYTYYFVVGLVLNIILNLVLKGIIQQPRPENMREGPGTFQKKVQNILHTSHGLPFNLFGMPSGHSQTIGYILSFLYGVFWIGMPSRSEKTIKPSWSAVWAFLAICAITLVQRVEWGHHTWFQVLVGTVVGTGVGYGMYQMSAKKIKGVMTDRIDDFAFMTKKWGMGFL